MVNTIQQTTIIIPNKIVVYEKWVLLSCGTRLVSSRSAVDRRSSCSTFSFQVVFWMWPRKSVVNSQALQATWTGTMHADPWARKRLKEPLQYIYFFLEAPTAVAACFSIQAPGKGGSEWMGSLDNGQAWAATERSEVTSVVFATKAPLPMFASCQPHCIFLKLGKVCRNGLASHVSVCISGKSSTVLEWGPSMSLACKASSSSHG